MGYSHWSSIQVAKNLLKALNFLFCLEQLGSLKNTPKYFRKSPNNMCMNCDYRCGKAMEGMSSLKKVRGQKDCARFLIGLTHLLRMTSVLLRRHKNVQVSKVPEGASISFVGYI